VTPAPLNCLLLSLQIAKGLNRFNKDYAGTKLVEDERQGLKALKDIVNSEQAKQKLFDLDN
jgi:hypothetical protein